MPKLMVLAAGLLLVVGTGVALVGCGSRTGSDGTGTTGDSRAPEASDANPSEARISIDGKTRTLDYLVHCTRYRSGLLEISGGNSEQAEHNPPNPNQVDDLYMDVFPGVGLNLFSIQIPEENLWVAATKDTATLIVARDTYHLTGQGIGTLPRQGAKSRHQIDFELTCVRYETDRGSK